ncbi:hypothetical protein EOI86_06925 [Hwanghaeella grinnelliae]|uniref:Transporter substrate-binding domain-containing protein n=1 Tax=Hwanghaeella grinnelliae TaxID=2500179 RepID=A0A437QX37_9PROT|nr:hypothetical protein [Hwanghaeella grinnelliae]RVU38986.1 hypothetical protein EOI86_06925 [Hwanghaeella grinnelliae]
MTFRDRLVDFQTVVSRLFLAALIAALAIQVSFFAYADDCLRLGSTDAVGLTLAGRLHENLGRALNRVGICHHFVLLPANRTTELLKQGTLDGEIDRVTSYLETVSEFAFMLEEPTVRGEGFIVVNDPAFNTLSDADAVTIGIVRGFNWHSKLAPRFAKTVVANEYAHLVGLFLKGRVGVIPIDNYTLRRFPSLETYRKIKISESALHIFLRKELADTGRRINAALKEYKSLGCRFDLADGGPDCRVAD